MTLYIKNMVCERCITAVRQQLSDLNIHPLNIKLGEVEMEKALTNDQSEILKKSLLSIGFELLDDSRKQMIEKIKTAVIEQVHYTEAEGRFNFSGLLSGKLHKDYSYLSNLFSEVEGITIEKYIINQKIEKVKELLVYDELSVSQISDELGYSSVAHLSAQFKKVTGLTPSHFKKTAEKIESLWMKCDAITDLDNHHIFINAG